MRPRPLPRLSRPTATLAVVFAVAIGSTLMGSEDGALAMREARSSAPQPVPAAARPVPPAASTRAPRPDAESASLRFWRNGGLPKASAPDESAPVTVVVAERRAPGTHQGIGRAVAIWRDGGER